jgi:transcription antitermination protein NusB
VRTRRAARELALDVLYESEIRGLLPVEALEVREREGWVMPTSGDERDASPISTAEAPSPVVIEYARILVDGVQTHHADIDHMITLYADHWAIDRMPVIDRNLIRIALYELFWGNDVPVAVAINEAVELAKAFSTEDSGRFVNGLLGRIVEQEQAR